MFGAPAGIRAGLEDNRNDLLGGLKALELMGEIEQQPLKADLYRAQARAHGAEADTKLAELATQKRLGELMGKAQAEQSDDPVNSMGNQLTTLSGIAYQAGAYKLGADFATKASNIFLKGAQIDATQASQALREIRTAQIHATRVGSYAQSALQNPELYPQIRLAMENENYDTSALPQNVAEALPMLQTLVAQSMSAKDKLELDAKNLQQKSKEKMDGKRSALIDSQIATNGARIPLIKARADAITKELGGGSGTAAAARKELAKTRQQKRALELQKSAKVTPLGKDGLPDKTKLQIGEPYKTPTGVHVWTGAGWTLPFASTQAAADEDLTDEDEE